MLRFALLLLCGLAAAVFDKDIHEKFMTMPRDEFIEYFNGLNLSFKIAAHEHLTGMNLTCTIINEKHKLPVKHFDEYASLAVPDTFDARQNWPQCASISTVYQQGGCGSCWTFGTATSASDRTCIHTGVSVELAEQDLQCCPECYDGYPCNGGVAARAFQFWETHGLVTQECKPYDPKELETTVCKTKCVNGADYQSDKHYAEQAYQVPSDPESIKAELFSKGPIEASMIVFDDFVGFHGSGIYEHKFGNSEGGHSVRVIGYGVENGVEYWLGANSWGPEWGDGGFFKIKRNQDEIQFESTMITGMPRSS